MLTDDSLGGQLNLMFTHLPPGRKLRIKLEIDTNPPAGSLWDQRFHDFPTDFSVLVQDLPSNFALKLHALLCRPYIKGRDWFDLLWYIRNGALPNLGLLQNAVQQVGPFAGGDVEPFLSAMERCSLTVWGEPLFTERVQQLCGRASTKR